MATARRIFRRALRSLGRWVLRVLTHTTITGEDRFPPHGPYIIAGNHRGIMEALLMMVAAPREIEIIGAGDIPLDRRYRYFAHLYGYIPYRRGQLDRAALRKAQAVLQAGGVVGIFPEGGIWQAARSSAHRGVSWLSMTTGAAVVPVGFGGVSEAVHRTVTLRFPRLAAHVGDPIFPDRNLTDAGRREAMDHFAEHVLDHIDELIPAWDHAEIRVPVWEEYELLVDDKPAPRGLVHPDLVARLLHLSVIVDALYFNLKRRAVAPLRRLSRPHSAQTLCAALRVAAGYDLRTNPAFYSYRMGAETAVELRRALLSLSAYLAGLPPSQPVKLTPAYRYRWEASSPVVEEREPRPRRKL